MKGSSNNRGRTRRLFGTALILAVGVAGQTSDSSLRLGTAYSEKFPKVEFVIEFPRSSPLDAGKLSASDFLLVEDGTPTEAAQTLKNFKDTDQGIAIVVAIDTSRSMSAAQLDGIKQALHKYLAEKREVDRIAITSFHDDFTVDAGFEATKEQLTAAVDGLRAQGNFTELYKGIFKSLTLLEAPGLPKRKRLVVISDGKDEGLVYKTRSAGSSFNPDDILRRAELLKVPIDAIGVPTREPMYLNTLERFSLNTGGNYSRAETPEAVGETMRLGIQWLQDTPVVSFESTHLPKDGAEHRIGIRIAKFGAERETRIVTPKEEGVPRWVYYAGGGLGAGLLVMTLVMLVRRKPTVVVQTVQPAAHTGPVVPPLALDAHPQAAGPKGKLPTWVEGEAGGFPAPPPQFQQPGPPPNTGVPGVFPGPLTPPPGAAGLPQSGESGASRRRMAATRIGDVFRRPAPGVPTALLAARGGPLSGHLFPIEREQYFIGYAEDNHLCLNMDEHVSSYHAYVQYSAGVLMLYDNKSTNGTRVNGDMLVGAARALNFRDVIRIGTSDFELLPPAE